MKTRKNKTPSPRITESDRQKIIEFYKTQKNNTVVEMIKILGYSKHQIDLVLNNHLNPALKNAH